MNRLILWLSIALAVQLMIAGGLMAAHRNGSNTEKAAESLLAFERESIDRIIVSTDESSVTMTKTENQWRLDGQHNLPVAENKLAGVLDQIATVKAGWPVAQTKSSRKRLEVADDKYQKRLQIYSGDEMVSDLYVGTSPGFRKVHVRRAGEDEVYSVVLNSYDLTTKVEDWLDKELLKVDGISQITGTDFSLKKMDDSWTFVNEENQDALELDQDKAKELASAISRLRVQDIADRVFGEAAIEIIVLSSEGEVKFQFAEHDNKYYVSRDDVDAAFTLSKFDYERITKFNRNQLAKHQAAREEKTEEKS